MVVLTTIKDIHSCTRYVRNVGEEEDWKKKTRDRGGWKRLSDEAVKKLPAAPHLAKGKRGRERFPVSVPSLDSVLLAT